MPIMAKTTHDRQAKRAQRGQILREEKPRERLLFDINRRQSEILTEFSRKASF